MDTKTILLDLRNLNTKEIEIVSERPDQLTKAFQYSITRMKVLSKSLKL